MDWNTLLTFALGGLTAFIPTILSNRHQSKEKEKDRLEQRRDARIYTKEKWEERDILQIMDSMDVLIRSFSEIGILVLNYERFVEKVDKEISEKSQLIIDGKTYDERFSTLFLDLQKTMDSMGRLVFSFDDTNIRSTFTSFAECANKALVNIGDAFENLNSREPISAKVINLYDLKLTAGNLQQALRNKLISLRDE